MKQVLREFVAPKLSDIILESRDETNALGHPEKTLYLQGICIQGGIKNANGRVYPVHEIAKAVKSINEQLDNGYSIMGEADHPDDLTINLDRVSHSIISMWMDGPNGYGKLKILPTPMGNLIRTLLESGVKLGVSSRGSGNVKSDGSGEVSDFEIITVDAVATPSGPGCFPNPIYEHFMNSKGGFRSIQIAQEVQGNSKAQKYLKESLINIITKLK